MLLGSLIQLSSAKGKSMYKVRKKDLVTSERVVLSDSHVSNGHWIFYKDALEPSIRPFFDNTETCQAYAGKRVTVDTISQSSIDAVLSGREGAMGVAWAPTGFLVDNGDALHRVYKRQPQDGATAEDNYLLIREEYVRLLHLKNETIYAESPYSAAFVLADNGAFKCAVMPARDSERVCAEIATFAKTGGRKE